MELPSEKDECFCLLLSSFFFLYNIFYHSYLDKLSLLGSSQKKGSSVLLCHPLTNPDKTYVMKIISKSDRGREIISGEKLYFTIPEAERTYFVKYHKTWEDDDNFYIVMDYLPNGTLTSFILQQEKCGTPVPLSVC